MPSSLDGSLRGMLVALAVLAALALPVWFLLSLRIADRRSLLPPITRRPVSWTGFDILLVLLLHFALRGAGEWLFKRYVAANDPRAGIYLALATTVVHALTLAGAVTYLHVVRAATWRDLGLASPQFGRDVLTGLVAALAVLFPVLGLNVLLVWVLEPTAQHPVIEMLLKSRDVLTFASLTFVAVAIVPPAEEFLYRGLLQGWLEKTAFPTSSPGVPAGPAAWVALLGSSVVFAVMHSSAWPAPIPLFFFALVLGFLYQRTGSLWPSIVLHAVLNGTSLLIWRLVQ
ncbi:MAG: CPBP family intramembrane metalloprotease [Planctomycetia bacterium]|nr:CPBP family intramembrane metalloprotease [Planctomycetia bacterium]